MQGTLSAITLNDEPIREPIGGPETWEWKVESMLLAGQRQEKQQQATSYKLGGSPCFIRSKGLDQCFVTRCSRKWKGSEFAALSHSPQPMP